MWLANDIPEEIGYMYWRVELMWLANDIPEKIGHMCWQVELGMSYVAG